MERIIRALEKTHAERGIAPSLQSEPDSLIDQIKYTQTRSLPVSREFLRQQRVIAGYDPNSFVDAYKVLRTKVLHRMREQGWNVLAITSPGPSTGKTVTAINLAISLALEVDQTVLLVDANLRKPSVHKFFGLAPEFGLSDYLLDNVPVQNILLRPKDIRRFVILPGKRPLLDSSEMLSSPRMSQLVEDLKTRYPSRIVLFDLPHLGTADALAFAPYVDAALLVIEEGKTTQDELTHAIEQLQPTPLLGTVLNKAEMSDSCAE